MTTEEWRDVRGFENYYEVSDMGRIRSKDRKVPNTLTGGFSTVKGRELQGKINKGGYRQVTLCVGQKNTTRLVHRLVAEAFYGPAPKTSPIVRHLNGDPSDNRATNLRWGTYSENAQDRIRHGRDRELNKTHCPAGHPYSEENTRKETGGRKCRTCARRRAREAYWKRRNDEVKRRLALGLPEITPKPRCASCGQFANGAHVCNRALAEAMKDEEEQND